MRMPAINRVQGKSGNPRTYGPVEENGAPAGDSATAAVRSGIARLQLAFLPTLGVAYLALSLLKGERHEMWRDELELWALARQSGSFAELVRLYRHSGQPFLWPFCVYCLHRLTDSPIAVQMLHAVIATAAVTVMVRFAPWSTAEKLAMAFGYYLFYEYNTIARCYGLGVLLIFVACALLCSRRRRWGFLAAALFLLSQTNAYGLIIAFAIYAAAVLQYRGSVRATKAALSEHLRFAGFSAAVALGALLSVISMTGLPENRGATGTNSQSTLAAPPHESGHATAAQPLINPLLAARAVTRVWRAYVPIPLFQLHFWNTNILEEHRPLQALLGALLLISIFLMLWRSRAALTLWLTGTLCILLFIYTTFDGYQRHHGHLFLVFLAAWWIRERAAADGFEQGGRSQRWRERAGGVIIAALLCGQLAAGVFASLLDVVYPFSLSREVAHYVARLGDNEMIVGDADHAATAVAIWLNRPFYQVARGQSGITLAPCTFRQGHVPAAGIYDAASRIKAARRQGVLILVNHAIPPRPGFPLLRKFDGAICASEEYQLYGVE